MDNRLKNFACQFTHDENHRRAALAPQGGLLPIEDGASRGPEEPEIRTPPAAALPTEALCFFYPVSLTSLKCLRMVSWILELFSYGIMSPHK